MKYLNSISFITILSIGFASLVSCSSNEKAKETEISAPVKVEIAKASSSSENGVSASGQIEASETANISTRVMGYILKINAKVGDQVKSGQVLVSLNNEDMSAKKAQAEAMMAEANANLQNAQKDYTRFTALYKQQSASAKELDNVTLQYNSAKARLEAAKQMRNEVSAMMNYTTIVAPFSGIITQKLADEGSLANPGMPILILEKSGNFQISATIPESEISKVKLNDLVSVNVKSTGKEFKSKITEMSPSSQSSGGQYLIKVSVPEEVKKDLYAGMYVNIFVKTKGSTVQNSEDVILIPQSAIVKKDQLAGLFTISQNKTALLRWVRLGKVYGNSVEVISGIDKDETYILHADGKLFNGAAVLVK
jgi:RND family efflux transporter MFP subunit